MHTLMYTRMSTAVKRTRAKRKARVRTCTQVGVYTGEPRTRARSPSGYAPALNADPEENEG